MKYKSGIDVEFLQKACHDLYITPNQLNKIAGFSPGYLSRFYGKRSDEDHSITTDTMDRLATALANLMTEKNQPIPDDLWNRLIEVKIEV